MNDKLRIIGLSGTNGSGKDTIGELLAEKYNYLFISVTELLRDEARKRGIPVGREQLRTISAEWRRQQGLGVLVDHAVDAYKKTGNQYAGLVMSSLRNPAEITRLHELGGTLVWVDADVRVRYDRIQAGAALRDRADEDNKTFEQFKIEQAAEMAPPVDGDEATLNMGAVKEMADIFIYNNGNEIEAFKRDAAVQLAEHGFIEV